MVKFNGELTIYSNKTIQAQGKKIADGYYIAWNKEMCRQVAVSGDTVHDEHPIYHILIPLNGWRQRELLGTRQGEHTDLNTAGYRCTVTVEQLQNLPGLDQFYYDYINNLQRLYTTVSIKVIMVDPSYGCHIAVNVL